MGGKHHAARFRAAQPVNQDNDCGDDRGRESDGGEGYNPVGNLAFGSVGTVGTIRSVGTAG